MPQTYKDTFFFSSSVEPGMTNYYKAANGGANVALIENRKREVGRNKRDPGLRAPVEPRQAKRIACFELQNGEPVPFFFCQEMKETPDGRL